MEEKKQLVKFDFSIFENKGTQKFAQFLKSKKEPRALFL